jgi:GNAT superfamily N-acetyltransferase
MRNTYTISNIDRKEIDMVAELYKACFGRDAGVDLFTWKYLNNPGGEALSLAVRCDADIVGSCVMIPENVYVFGKKKKIYKCADLMVHPEHRRKGLSVALIRSLCERLKQDEPLFLYTLCSKNVTPGFVKNKWIKLGDVYSYFKHTGQCKIKFLFNHVRKLYEKGILKQIYPFSNLCKEYKFKIDEMRIGIVKDESYLCWRLSDPRYRYSIIGYYEDSELKGYIIYNVGIHDIVYIVDVEAYNDDARILKVLINAVEAVACEFHRRLIVALATDGSNFQKTIKRNHYVRNLFSKGPLSSIMDFNILIDNVYDDRAQERLCWDIRPMQYDGI